MRLSGSRKSLPKKRIKIKIKPVMLTHPSPEKEGLLSKRDMADAMGDRLGKKANEKGSLTGLVIARYGTSESALDEGDVERLRGWFESGGAGI